MKLTRHGLMVLFLVAGIALLLAACEPAPACDPSELTAPQITTTMGPAPDAVTLDLTPDFEWLAVEPGCRFDGYRIELVNDDDPRSAVISATTWTPATGLNTGSRYAWHVAAVALDGTVGPYSPLRQFFTGPVCTASQSWSTTLLSPARGEIVTNLSPELIWQYPDASCWPEGFQFQVWPAPDGPNAISGIGLDTSFDTNLDYLQDCILYYWTADAIIGGVSVERTFPSYFATDLAGACPGAPCDASTLVAPIPISPLSGDVVASPFISLTIDYEFPVCRATLQFYFELARDAKFTDLVVYGTIQGGWSTFDPAAVQHEDCTRYYWRAAAEIGSDRGPFSEAQTYRTDFTGACGRSAAVKQDALCRDGPTLDYPIRLYMGAGEEVLLIGRNPDGSWLLIDRPDGRGECWIALTLLNGVGDPLSLPEQEVPPLEIVPVVTETPAAGPPVDCTLYSWLACPVPPCVKVNYQTHYGGYCRNP